MKRGLSIVGAVALFSAIVGAFILAILGANAADAKAEHQRDFNLLCRYNQGQPQGQVCIKDSRVILRYEDVAKLIEESE